MLMDVQTLEARLAEIAAEEAALAADGHIVFALTDDIAYWNECGIFTGADLDAMLDAEVERERRKEAMYDDEWLDDREEEWLAECEEERSAYEDRLREIDQFMAVPVFSETKFYRECAAHQDGWL